MSKVHLVSSNLKTTWSINFPIRKTCSPTPHCIKFCYARHGRLAMNNSLARQELIYSIFREANPNLVAKAIEDGCNERKLSFLRWCGSGDLFVRSVIILNRVAAMSQQTIHWVTTRKPSMVSLISDLPNIYIGFSLDRSEESKKRKKIVQAIDHPRLYYSFVREDITDDTMGASIIFNMQQKKKSLPYDDPTRVCPVDAGRLEIKGACEKCRMCFSPQVLQRCQQT